MENPFEIINQRLDRIEELLEANLGNLCNNKITYNIPNLMMIKDVANYLNLSISTIYGYTAKKVSLILNAEKNYTLMKMI